MKKAGRWKNKVFGEVSDDLVQYSPAKRYNRSDLGQCQRNGAEILMKAKIAIFSWKMHKGRGRIE